MSVYIYVHAGERDEKVSSILSRLLLPTVAALLCCYLVFVSRSLFSIALTLLISTAIALALVPSNIGKFSFGVSSDRVYFFHL